MEYRSKIQNIKSEYLKGHITFEKAKSDVELLLVEMNKKGADVAKKFGKNYKKLTFTYVFR